MSIVPARLIPSDVRQVIDRTDCKFDKLIVTAAITSEQLSEVVSLLIKNNTLLAEQNRLLRARQ